MTAVPEDSTALAAVWPQPLPDADTAGFWAATAAGSLSICRCTQCGHWTHAPLERCRRCAGPVEFQPVSGRGALHSWIVVHRQSVPGPTVPYLIGLAELDEDPLIRLIGVLRCADPGAVRIGVPVTVELEPVPGGEFVAPVIIASV